MHRLPVSVLLVTGVSLVQERPVAQDNTLTKFADLYKGSVPNGLIPFPLFKEIRMGSHSLLPSKMEAQQRLPHPRSQVSLDLDQRTDQDDVRRESEEIAWL